MKFFEDSEALKQISIKLKAGTTIKEKKPDEISLTMSGKPEIRKFNVVRTPTLPSEKKSVDKAPYKAPLKKGKANPVPWVKNQGGKKGDLSKYKATKTYKYKKRVKGNL